MISSQRKKNIVYRDDDDVFSDFCVIPRIPRRFRVSLKRPELCIPMANSQSWRKRKHSSAIR